MLRALSAFTRDGSSVLNTHLRCLTTACNPAPRHLHPFPASMGTFTIIADNGGTHLDLSILEIEEGRL